jgi:5-methyltetrahydrofolate--homocysteine methyltransferase
MKFNGFILFDGAMGTILQERGLKTGDLPELLNISAPELITRIHKEYLAAGADVITANTFQANPLKYPDKNILRQIIEAGISCAKKAGAKTVALDIGPLGRLLAPMGTMAFEEAYGYFKETAVLGAAAGADIILLETFGDIYEAKSAVLAAKENCGLPVVCSLTFQADGRTFAGCSPACAAVTLQGLGVDALGVNCSLGPKELHGVVNEILNHSSIPVIVQPNAGLPKIKDERTVFDVSPKDFAAEMSLMADAGVSVLGGCCGTAPAHIAALKKMLSQKVFRPRASRRITACSSGTDAVIFCGGPVVIGERLNPTGKKKLKEALRNYDKTFIAREAVDQTVAGSDILDVNVGLPELDEKTLLVKVIRDVQEVTALPLQIDSSDPAAITAALRVYNGKAVINSVNGKEEVMDAVFPAAKKYGALVVGLTIDGRGIPPTAQERLEIARRIVARAEFYGIAKSEIIIDCLTLTASAQQEEVLESLRAVKLVKDELGCKTVLGVSNVSFGFPQRDLLNSVFLSVALGAGLDAAIINPLSVRYTEVLDAFRVLCNADKNALNYVKKYSAGALVKTDAPYAEGVSLREIILQGRKDDSAAKVRSLLQAKTPLEIVNGEFIPALNAAGADFETGKKFLPQLLQSAQAVQNGFEVIKDYMSARGMKKESRGKILLATVQGDIHDIGKNIVRMILENYGFEIIDLGKDVKVADVVEAVRAHGVRLAGLSALMTTTVKNMKDTISAVKNARPDCKFMVGGAVLNEEYKDFVGADFYARDAVESAKIAEKFFENAVKKDILT